MPDLPSLFRVKAAREVVDATLRGEAVRTVIGITDRAAEATTAGIRTRMMTAFIRSTQYEFLFWDGAYQQRGWPLA